MDRSGQQRPPPGQGVAGLVIGPDGRPLASNEAFADLFGRVHEPPAWDAEGRELSAVSLLRAVKPGDTFRQTLLLQPRGGARRPFAVSGQALYDAERTPSGWLLLFETPADADNAAEVAELLSHEIRTPLTALHAALQLLERALPRAPDGVARHYLAQAMAESRNINALTSHLMDAERVQSGQLELRCESVSLNSVVRQVAQEAQSTNSAQHIDVSLPHEEIVVSADRPRLEQMLMSLLANAFKYASTTPRVDLRLRRQDGQARIEVRDYGAGIDPDRLAHVAEPFYQVPRSDRPSRAGLGLSLYLCRELARLHGGQLDISSSAQGSTFALRLPLAQPAENCVREDVRPARNPSRPG